MILFRKMLRNPKNSSWNSYRFSSKISKSRDSMRISPGSLFKPPFLDVSDNLLNIYRLENIYRASFYTGKSHFSCTQNVWNLKKFLTPTKTRNPPHKKSFSSNSWLMKTPGNPWFWWKWWKKWRKGKVCFMPLCFLRNRWWSVLTNLFPIFW